MAEQVASHGIPNQLTSSISFQPVQQAELVSAWQSVNKGLVPIVIIRGKAKSNPTVQEVLDEYMQASKPTVEK